MEELKARARVQALRLAVVSLCVAAPAWGASVNYDVRAPVPAPFVPLTAGTMLKVDSYSGIIVKLPFSFRFFRQEYESISVSTNGYVSFAGEDQSPLNQGIPAEAPSTSYPMTFIAPWWDSLRTTSATPSPTVVQHQTTGVAPNRVWTLEWKDILTSNNTAGRFSFQVKLYEGTQQIRMAYGPTAPTGTVSASVGIQAEAMDGAAALQCTVPKIGSCSAAQFPKDQAIDLFFPADLTVSGAAGEDTGYGGVPFRTSVLVTNAGGLEAKNVRVRFYLSSDARLDVGRDPVLGMSDPVDLPALGQRLVAAAGSPPVGTPPGDYFLIATVDPDGVVSEVDEGNNASIPVGVRVGPPTADLSLGALNTQTTRSTPGAEIAISRQVLNRGNANVTTSTRYTYFLSDNAVVSTTDRVLGEARTLGPLASGASVSGTDRVVLPTGLAGGRYWVGLCLDYDPTLRPETALSEISELNNCGVVSGGGIVVDGGAVAILTQTLPTVSQYSPVGLKMEANGGDGLYEWFVISGALPLGVTLAKNGDLVGTPSVVGTFQFNVKVVSAGKEAFRDFSMWITPGTLPLAVVDQDLPSGEVGRAYSYSLVGVGGAPPYRWRLTKDTRLPLGIALSADGRLEGRPGEVGEVPFDVELTDSAGARAGKSLRFHISTYSGLRIATTALAQAFLGDETTYIQPLRAAGGNAPYQWRLFFFQRLAEHPYEKPGPRLTDFPTNFGLAVNPDQNMSGSLTGKPTKAGLYALTLQVSDAEGQAQVTTLLLRVVAPNALGVVTVDLPDAFVGEPYHVKLSHNATPEDRVTFSVPCLSQVNEALTEWQCEPSAAETQKLPAGLQLEPDGTLSGTPQGPTSDEPVMYSFFVRASDIHGRVDDRSLSIKLRNDFTPKSGCTGTGAGPLPWLGVVFGLAWFRRRRAAVWAGLIVLLAMAGGFSCTGAKKDCAQGCPAPLVCDKGDGVCKCGGRGGTVCPQTSVCDAASNLCVRVECSKVRCSNGNSCDAKDLRCKCGGTDGAVCAAGEFCNAAKACALPVDCSQVACPAHETCNPSTGLCVCGLAACAAGTSCAEEDGHKVCVTHRCFGVTCAGFNVCDPQDGHCKCRGVVCQAGEACACPNGGADCLDSARTCALSSACVGKSCPNYQTCDPVDGQCKCGGPGAPACTSEQVCRLETLQCQGGQQCENADGTPKSCPSGTSCDSEDGQCKCGGNGGQVCAAASGAEPAFVCVSSSLSRACRKPCDPRSPDCPVGESCYFDSTIATPAAYCVAHSDSKVEGSACISATACFENDRALHCQTGICRPYCDVAAGTAGCPQIAQAQICRQISGAPVGVGYCAPQ